MVMVLPTIRSSYESFTKTVVLYILIGNRAEGSPIKHRGQSSDRPLYGVLAGAVFPLCTWLGYRGKEIEGQNHMVSRNRFPGTDSWVV